MGLYLPYEQSFVWRWLLNCHLHILFKVLKNIAFKIVAREVEFYGRNSRVYKKPWPELKIILLPPLTNPTVGIDIQLIETLMRIFNDSHF